MSSDYEEIRRKNIREYGEGTRHLSYFADIYSTRTHFIFEILQNAEDALGRRPILSPDGYVHFRLYTDRLEIRHNGQSFSEQNVVGICGIGEGTKAADYTQIGKFGIGFKSVYAYTFFPKIHSGDEHFEIRRFVEPFHIDKMPEGDTLIVLPFDEFTIRPDWAFRDNVPAAVAVQEIGEAIRNLGVRSLLFLKHVKEVKWHLPDRTSGHFIRDTTHSDPRNSERTVEVLDHNDQIEEWRIFQKAVEIDDGGEKHQATVEVAFLIRDNTLVRADNTELVVFFPTTMKTELGFLIHAPFKATKARNDIKRDDPANHQLIVAAAELAGDALEVLRDHGLLAVSSYAALPLRKQDFPDGNLFRPVFDKIRDALRTKRLLPLQNGAFTYVTEAKLARGEKLVDLFSAEQLGSIFGSTKLEWLDPSITENGDTADFHLYLVGRKKPYSPIIEFPPLVDGIQVDADNLVPKLTGYFLGKQPIEWLVRFIKYVIDGPRSLRKVPFIRLASNKQTTLPTDVSSTPSAWFAPADKSGLDLTPFDLIASELADNAEIKAFLRKEGIREIDGAAIVVKCILPLYSTGSLSWDSVKYGEHLRQISRSYQGNDDTKRQLVKSLNSVPWIACVHSSGSEESTIVWRKPGADDLFVRDKTSELWFRGLTDANAYFIHKKISEELGDIAQQLTRPHGITLNLNPDENTVLLQNHDYVQHKRGLRGFNPEATVASFPIALCNWNIERFRILWNIMLAAPRIISGETQSSSNKGKLDAAEKITEYSEIGRLVIGSPCFPDRHWIWRKPCDLLISDLPDDFEMSSSRSEDVARRLGIKRPVDLHEVAKAFGITSEDAERRMRVTQEELNEIERHREEKRRAENLPNKISPDPDRRTAKIIDEAKDALPKTKEIRERQVDLDYNPAQGDARTYLEGQYTNDNGVMFCQLCKAPQPVLLNGKPHFEAVSCVADVNTHYEQNNLALCPNHAAMYKHSGIVPATIQRAVLECVGQAIQLNLAGNVGELYFTQQHLGDLRALIVVMSENAED